MNRLVTLLFLLASLHLGTTPCVAQGLQPERPIESPDLMELAGRALWRAHAAKALERLLLDKRVFCEGGADPVLTYVQGSVEADTIRIQIEDRSILRDNGVRYAYEFGAQGAFKRVSVSYCAQGMRVVATDTGVVHGRELVVTTTGAREGQKPARLPWRHDTLLLHFATYVLPVLTDFGLALPLRARALSEDVISRPRSQTSLLTVKLLPQRPSSPRTYRLEGQFTLEVLVQAAGAQRGRITHVRYLNPTRILRRLTRLELAAVLLHAPLLRNETQTLRALRELTVRIHAQGGLKEGSVIGALKLPGYELLVEHSPDGSSWALVASPKTPGETGSRYFAASPGGLFSSERAIKLSPGQTLPRDLTRIR